MEQVVNAFLSLIDAAYKANNDLLPPGTVMGGVAGIVSESFKSHSLIQHLIKVAGSVYSNFEWSRSHVGNLFSSTFADRYEPFGNALTHTIAAIVAVHSTLFIWNNFKHLMSPVNWLIRKLSRR